MKFIYWNTKEISDFSCVLDILTDEKPDLFFLAETKQEVIDNNAVQLDLLNYEQFANPGCKRIIILKLKSLKLYLGKQTAYYSTVISRSKKVTVLAVHLPSQMYQSPAGLKSFLRDFRSEIDDKIGSALFKNIVIIGDFNVNPFESPMIDFDGFSASNTTNLRDEVTHLTRKKPLYYNPTWVLYSKNHFPGTKYFRRPSRFSFDVLEHHFLDQVVLSYYMSKNLDNEKIDVLYQTTNHKFFDQVSNQTLISDHLPLIYEFNLK